VRGGNIYLEIDWTERTTATRITPPEKLQIKKQSNLQSTRGRKRFQKRKVHANERRIHKERTSETRHENARPEKGPLSTA